MYSSDVISLLWMMCYNDGLNGHITDWRDLIKPCMLSVFPHQFLVGTSFVFINLMIILFVVQKHTNNRFPLFWCNSNQLWSARLFTALSDAGGRHRPWMRIECVCLLCFSSGVVLRASALWHLCHSAPVWQIQLRVVSSLLWNIFTAYGFMLQQICAACTQKAFLHVISLFFNLKCRDTCTCITCNLISSCFGFNITHYCLLLSLDVIGVCKNAEDVSRITTKSSREVSKRTLHLVDTTGKMVAATLWGEEVLITGSLYFSFLIFFKPLMDLQVKYIYGGSHENLCFLI